VVLKGSSDPPDEAKQYASHHARTCRRRRSVKIAREDNVEEPRPEKVAVIEEVRERFSLSSAAILTEYRGLKVKEMQALRRALTAAGGEYKVYKNTLVWRAAQESGLAELQPMLEGPTAIAFVRGDVAAVAKVLRDFAKTSPSLVVKGGLVGRSLFDADGANKLAELPSRDVLLAQLAGAIAAPMAKLAALMKALPQNLAYGLSALLEARGGVPVEASADEVDATPESSAPPADEAEATPEASASPADETAGSAVDSPADASSAPAAEAPDEDLEGIAAAAAAAAAEEEGAAEAVAAAAAEDAATEGGGGEAEAVEATEGDGTEAV
jgi:large subunit ribosomal protein L10